MPDVDFGLMSEIMESSTISDKFPDKGSSIRRAKLPRASCNEVVHLQMHLRFPHPLLEHFKHRVTEDMLIRLILEL